MNLEEAKPLWEKFEAQTTWEEAKELYNAVINSPSGAIVEVGSACGGTTIVLIAAAQEVGKTVYSVDPYPSELEGVALYYTEGLMNSFKSKFQENILNELYNNIIQFNEDLKNCIDKIPDEISVAFIDGCHEFSFC